VPAPSGTKDPAAFRTIGEVSAELGIAQHILRYWESRFPQLKPLQRAGNRRYYRPEDVDLVRRIHSLLSQQGYTVRGVQQLLKGKEPLPEPLQQEDDLVGALKRLRADLVRAIGG
jgi:DNA-binding transcriptional MerR regulator